jgi:hypothetical protein
MRTSSAVRLGALFLAVAFTGCGGSGGGDSAPPPANPPANPPAATAQQGVFIDAAVQGLGFNSGTFSGRTDAQGQFQYATNETVTFSLGRTTLGSVAGGDVITPMTLAGTSDETDPRVVNLARLLQSLDADGNPENGIVLDDAVQTAANAVGPINLNQSVAAFAADPVVADLLRQARGPAATLVTTDRALGHLRDATFRFRYPGIWRVTSAEGSGEFAIDNDGRVRGSAVYQGNNYPLLGYVAGNGSVAIYAADPSNPLVQQYPEAIVTVARFTGKLVDTGTASGTSLTLQPNNAVSAGVWSATRTMPTFDLGIRADLAAIVERFHSTLPMTMRYTIDTEERRFGTDELLSDWYLAQGNACNQRRIGLGQPPTPLPSLAELRALDTQHIEGVYRFGRSVIRTRFIDVRFDSASTCEITLPPFTAEIWTSDPDDTVYSPQTGGGPFPFATAALPSFPLVLPQQYAIASGEMTGATGLIDQRTCLYSPNTDGTVGNNRNLQGRNCTLTFDGRLVVYRPLLSTLRREREGSADPVNPNDPSNTATTTTAISVQLNGPVRDDEVTPPVLRQR